MITYRYLLDSTATWVSNGRVNFSANYFERVRLHQKYKRNAINATMIYLRKLTDYFFYINYVVYITLITFIKKKYIYIYIYIYIN